MRGLLRKFLRMEIYPFLVVALASSSIFIIIRELLWGPYYYAYVDRENFELMLYREKHQDVTKDGRSLCSYKHILNNAYAIKARDVYKAIETFKDDGIADGSFSPSHCNPLSVAIIVTYRDRWEQLKVFVPYIHSFLRKQQIHYKIYIVEQDDGLPWNKGLLYNVGASVAIGDGFPCLILHDVDLLPLAPGNLYACSLQPRHLSAVIDKLRHVLPYDTLVGGVLAITSRHFQLINGLSNQFLEWGGEDTDLANRILFHNLTILRCDKPMSRYAMIPHRQHRPNPSRSALLAKKKAQGSDEGLSTLAYLNLRRETHKLYTLLKDVFHYMRNTRPLKALEKALPKLYHRNKTKLP